MNENVKKILNTMMEKNIDKLMENNGFKRRKNTFTYSRKIGTTKQKVEMVFFLHPSYQPGALAHVYPWLTVHFPEVGEMASKMLEENIISNWKAITIRQPVQIHTESERWMLMGDEVEKIGKNINSFFEKYTIPLLNDLKDIEDFIKLYELQDKRLIWDDNRHVYIISSYIIKGDYEKAQSVLEKRFGKLGPRRRYASAFDYLEKLINDVEK